MPPVIWAACLGRNGWDHPLAVPDDMGTEAINVIFRDSGLGDRRGGTETVPVTNAIPQGIAWMSKYVPPSGLSGAVLFLVSFEDPPRAFVGSYDPITGGIGFTALILVDGVQSDAFQVSTAQLNNKLFVAYHAGINRLHVWDPTYSFGTLVRTGLPAPAAPAVANTGVGTYPATPRWYRTRWRRIGTGVVVRQSEPSAATAFTPSGTGTAARISRPALAGETETHWVLEASADSVNGPFYEIAELVIATLTRDDSALPSTYNTGTVSATVGKFTCFPSVKFLVSDGNRLLGFGVWETALLTGASVVPVPGRVYYTPVLGSTDRGDDERIESTVATEGWIDLTPGGAGAEDRGLGGPLNGEIYAFQSKGIYRLVPTGQATAPFTRHQLTPHCGAVSNASIVLAEDEQGNQCVYFLNPSDGPRRIQLGGGMQWLGRDVYDLWIRVNPSAAIPAWGLYDEWNKRIIWGVPVDGASYPNLILMHDVTKGRTSGQIVRYGWAQWTEAPARWRTACMFPVAGGNVETPYGAPRDTNQPERFAIPAIGHDTDPIGGSYQQAVGSYQATGTAGTVIDVGFQPTVVIVRPIDCASIGVAHHIPAVEAAGCVRTSAMAGANSLRIKDSTIITTGITALTATGFTLGVSGAGNFASDTLPEKLRYAYIAIRDLSQVYFRDGSYVGDGTDDRNIVVGAGAFQPDLVWVFGNCAGGVVRDKNMGGDVSIALDQTTAVTNKIQAVNAGGFQVGTDAKVNNNGTTFYYLAWKDDGGGTLAAKALAMGTYAGSGVGQVIAAGWAGLMTPILDVMGPTAEGGAFAYSRHVAPNSTRLFDGTVRTTDITALGVNTATVGVGEDAAATTYYWHAWRAGAVAVPGGASYPASVTSKAYDQAPSLTRRKRITEAYLSARALVGGLITQILSRDWGAGTSSDQVSLAPEAAETRVRRRCEGVDMADAVVLQVTVGDDGTVPTSPRWSIDRWVGVVEDQDGAK